MEFEKGGYLLGKYDLSQVRSEGRTLVRSIQYLNKGPLDTQLTASSYPFPPRSPPSSFADVFPLPSFRTHTDWYIQAADVKDEETCKARCISTGSCVQVTWSVRPHNPCVLYQSTNGQFEQSTSVHGWMKAR
jgi:hypothetical protein